MTDENNRQPEAPQKPQRKIPRVEQAAILLMSLGENDAAEVLKHMGPKEVQRVGVAMAQMKDVSKDDVTYVLNQFVEAVGGQTGLGVGNDDYIRTMLTQALGDDKASSLIDRILIGGNTTGLDTLKWMEPRAVGDIIRYEHPQIQAIVISYLDPDQAAEILATLDDKVRLDDAGGLPGKYPAPGAPGIERHSRETVLGRLRCPDQPHWRGQARRRYHELHGPQYRGRPDGFHQGYGSGPGIHH